MNSFSLYRKKILKEFSIFKFAAWISDKTNHSKFLNYFICLSTTFTEISVARPGN